MLAAFSFLSRRRPLSRLGTVPFTAARSTALVLLLLLLLLLNDVAPHSLALAHSITTLCPRCPRCARPQTSLRDRLTYCHSTTSYALALFAHGKSDLAGGAAQRSGASHRTQRQRYPLELPFATDDAVRAQCMRDVADLLTSRVRGQPQVVKPLLDVLRRKLAYPREPVVIHLAGDNGVGKTHTARLVSQALSLRCAADRDVCDAGDNLLTIAGTGFDGMSVAEARARIVQQIMAHMEHYPHGVVLIDDLTVMDPALVTALAPLFGRATHFAEQKGDLPSSFHAVDHAEQATETGTVNSSATTKKTSQSAAHRLQSGLRKAKQSSLLSWPWRAPTSAPAAAPPPLSQLLVFITTDFGRQGRTVGKSRADIEAMVQHDFAAVYGTLLPAYTRTFVFFPFTTHMAEEVVRSVVTDLPCALGEHLIATSWISDDAVAFLVEQHRATWAGKENGHALRRMVEDELISQLIVYWELHAVQERLVVRFELDEAKLKVVLRLPTGSNAASAFAADSFHDPPQEGEGDL